MNGQPDPPLIHARNPTVPFTRGVDGSPGSSPRQKTCRGGATPVSYPKCLRQYILTPERAAAVSNTDGADVHEITNRSSRSASARRTRLLRSIGSILRGRVAAAPPPLISIWPHLFRRHGCETNRIVLVRHHRIRFDGPRAEGVKKITRSDWRVFARGCPVRRRMIMLSAIGPGIFFLTAWVGAAGQRKSI